MSKNKDKEGELIDIGKKLGKSQTKDALVKLLVVSSYVFEKGNIFLFELKIIVELVLLIQLRVLVHCSRRG